MAENQIHVPVMLERSIELLAPALGRPGAVLVDATLGMAGHAEAFLERFPELVLVGLDRDPDALAIAGERLAGFGDRVHLHSAGAYTTSYASRFNGFAVPETYC